MASHRSTDFGGLLLEARERAGLKRDDLAKRVGLDVSHLFRIETGGRRPSRDSALALAVALSLDDDAVNKMLVAAGYAPIPALEAVRDTVRARGTARTRGSGSGGIEKGEASSGATTRARRLEAIGLTQAAIARLLDALSAVDLKSQEEAAHAVANSITRVTAALESPIRTAVIPAAGDQHRMFAAHVMQRLLLAAIGEGLLAGVRDFVLVLAPDSVESLYTPIRASLELAVAPIAHVLCCVQPTPAGLGDAILRSRELAGTGPVAVLLPDDVTRERGRSISREFGRMLAAWRGFAGGSFIAASLLPKSSLLRGGVAQLASKPINGRVFPVLQLAERPGTEAPIMNARNTYGIVGRYVLEADVFDALVEIGKQDHPRLELTDALALVLARGGKVYAYEIEAKREDIGAVLAQASGFLSSEEPHRRGSA